MLIQLLTSKIHSDFNLKNKIIIFTLSIFLNGDFFAPSYTSPDLIQNLLSDRLWVWAAFKNCHPHMDVVKTSLVHNSHHGTNSALLSLESGREVETFDCNGLHSHWLFNLVYSNILVYSSTMIFEHVINWDSDIVRFS